MMNEKKKGFRVMQLIVRKASGPWHHFYALHSQKDQPWKTECSRETRLGRQRPARFSSSIDVFKEWCEEDLGEAHGVRRREPPRRLCITRWRVDVVVEDMARHTLYVGEPQVLLYLDDVKITPSNPRKAKPRAAPDTSSEAPDADVPRH